MPSVLTLAIIERSDDIPWLFEMHNKAPHYLERRAAANRIYELKIRRAN